ncbi:MAG: ABC transporter permease, partial [Gammaproteobacteria bacterium]|nr:ABC transporter permease [Gammaproteobacteria bacterium]
MSEILQITLVGLRSIPQRLGESCVVAIGIGCVVWVLIMALAMLGSLTDTLRATGHPDRALVLRNGAVAESLSSLTRDDVARLRSLPNIARLPGGDVAMSPEVLVSVMPDDVNGLVLVRGLTAAGFELRPELISVEGRMPAEGKHELMVGRLAQRSAPSFAIGSHLRVNAVDWRIVGVFESGGDVHESEMLADGPTLMTSVGRKEFSSATVQLRSAQDFDTLRAAVSSIPGANLKAERESDYYQGQSETMSRLVFIVAYVVCTIMAIGAT